MEDGFTILFVPNGRPSLNTDQVTNLDDWGFNDLKPQAGERAIEYPDSKRIAFLTFGGYEYYANTPPMSWLPPQSVLVYTNFQAFTGRIAKEIEQECMKGTYDFMPTVPFCVEPAAAITKPRNLDKLRTIWSPSVPG